MLYLLSDDLVESVSWLIDRHVCNQTLDACRVMLGALRIHGCDFQCRPFDNGQVENKNTLAPDLTESWTVWASKNRENFLWVADYAEACVREYERRYGWRHTAQPLIGRITGEEAGERRYWYLPKGRLGLSTRPRIGREEYQEMAGTWGAEWRRPAKKPDWWI